MKKSFWALLGLVLLLESSVLGFSGRTPAKVKVAIDLGPPPIMVSAPSEVVMMPGTNIYFVPSNNFDVFFYNGYWWSPRGERWYRAGQYNGPWGYVHNNDVPGHLFKVPKNYRVVYKKERIIKYGHWKQQH
ncbi:hypothetical protein A2291_01915 [candidate division WOR-1 bacterium RIFOXYB2_FULL_42_35]|uniref:Uncharacterized protein n=1 Tax=candidate division WOR-1 bacterium RIFOXYC2_FULL_41_25 TaxID=1802586 RepID=A0A1F4TPT0_UNCSA|nr:MAG: hypothetical protein A2247_03715 [candidate division WOR-1 bacterium RIFOXYA2_FULL_41_14]OGC25159.1 MAG: hypothetical protein A2291_01915 [candidate division WOR-1 bacterium RIFOXYB2_FULL_42_35]OGC34715.1 MAG: hypothetical protein A2462_03230 [candidate division WOR-1 bacterium RIFOXYC2_FULL_41_25]